MPDRRESRSDILSAVVAVLSTRGAEHLSIRTVAAEAGVSVGAVQHHFPTKQALLAGAMARVEERFRERMRSRLEAESSAEVRLRVFCDE
ncbi:TetR/AcrR family transcriptional regulator, partial [Rathayibacter sp. AY1A7]